jgi:hypothetical protein
VEVGVFGGDCQPEAGSTHGSLSGWVGSPKTVENPIEFVAAHADAVVLNRDRDCVIALTNRDVNRFTLPVFDCV